MNAKETPVSPTYYKVLFAILLVLATGLAVWAGYNHLQSFQPESGNPRINQM